MTLRHIRDWPQPPIRALLKPADNSVGMKVSGIKDVDYAFREWIVTGTPWPWSGYWNDVEGTYTVMGYAYSTNSGSITVGANSTGVEITGYGLAVPVDTNGDGQYDAYIPRPQFFNAGHIDGSADNSVALSVNVDYRYRLVCD